MGAFGHDTVYSSKYLNAEITDAGDRIHVVHVKYILGDYFVTKIDGQTYVFRIKGKIYTYHTFAMRTVRKIYYNTKHYMPISHDDYKKIELMLKVNSLPKLDRRLFNVLQYLGKTERGDFKEHDMESVFNLVAREASQYTEEAKNMKNFLDHLKIEKIVTPVKEVTEFIQEDLIATDPQFFGDVLPAFQRLDHEDKLITNKPVRGKKNIVKFVAIMLGVALVALLLLHLNSTGAFSQITSPFDSVGTFFKTQGGGAKSTSSLPAECQGLPEDCKKAVDSGRVKLAQLPDALRGVIEKMPTVTPRASTVELTP
ncbi:MAG: hypothetical protein LV468_01290 [Candidatus Nitrosotenuis sp.]|nr:hypothetical protein [Candidatus Nitrosotenuis sp.]